VPADVDVAVIGGGLAGISAALAAKKAGAEVVVLEAGATAGGKAQTSQGLEHGPQTFNGRYEVFWKLLEELGLTAAAVPIAKTRGTRYLARGGRLHALKPSVLTLLFTQAVSVGEKLAVAADLLRRRPVQPAASVHDFFAARFGTSFASGPVAAMINGIYTGDPRELAVDGCFPDLQANAVAERSIVRGLMRGPKTGRRGIFTLEGGLGRIGQAAQKLLNIELQSPVRELSRDSDGFRLTAARPLRARAVVVATEAHVAAKLLWPTSPKLGAALGQMKYAPLTVVHWEGDASRFGEGFGYLACPSEQLFALGTMFHGRRFSSFVRGVEHNEAALADGIAGDLQRLTGGAFGKVLRIDRHEHAVFQPTVGVLPVRAGLQALADEAGVCLAGSYLGAAAMKDALHSGFAAGQQAYALSQRRPAWSRSLS
jgi:oxygen-dependent protoporphyrinogen oxidase